MTNSTILSYYSHSKLYIHRNILTALKQFQNNIKKTTTNLNSRKEWKRLDLSGSLLPAHVCTYSCN